MKLTRLIPTLLVLHLPLMNGSCTDDQVAYAKLPTQVPQRLVDCAKQKGVVIPPRKLTEAELEKLYKTDRLTIVVLRGCFSELIVRDQRLAAKR